jgi:serine/threonine-protein kinase
MRYRILGQLGQGGMGTVYRAEHVALRRPVALKVLDAEFQGTDMERRFEREARTAARLDHPGCVRVLDHGRTVDKQLYLAMELLDGVTLATWMQQAGTLASPDAVRATCELLEALGYAHEQGVLHRDVKPENVMFAKRAGKTTVVLIDFGLARLCDDAGITQRGACMGSPSYVAPERLLGESADERSDIYSVGVMLYEMLSGRRPFGNGEAMDIALRQIEVTPPHILELRPDLPPALALVVTRALEKDPARRFASAHEMRAALSGVASGSQPLARTSRITTAIAALPAAPTPPPLPVRSRAATMPPPVPAAAMSTRPLQVLAPEPSIEVLDVASLVAATEASSPESEPVGDGPPTLHWRAVRPVWWRRALAWLRHGAWRWREPVV